MLRDATPDDARAIETVRLSAWRAVYAPLLPPGALDAIDLDAWIARRRRRLAGESRAHFTVAGHDDTVMAFCGRGPYRDDDLHDTDEIYALYADPGAWSTGLGRALMTDALARSRRPTVLWVLRENARARRFYERAGFAPDGAQKTLDFHGAFPIEIRYRYDG